jgi:hypothetical protein
VLEAFNEIKGRLQLAPKRDRSIYN